MDGDNEISVPMVDDDSLRPFGGLLLLLLLMLLVLLAVLDTECSCIVWESLLEAPF